MQRSVKGQEVFDKVCHHLSLPQNEKDYFACSFKDEKATRVSMWIMNISIRYYLGYWHHRADERHGNLTQGNQELLWSKTKL